MSRSRPWTVLWLLAAAAAPALAQSHDPELVATVVRIELADGTPMPGVPIHRDRGVAAAAADGWLRRADPRLRTARLPLAGRSDPTGTLTLMASDGRLGPRELQAGAPFRGGSLQKEDGTYVLRVTRLEQFVVQALDATGAPLPDFPLALQRNGDDEALAVTDARGRATFAVDPATSARLVVVPYGWLGPIDAFPTVAKQLPDKHLTFTVPAFGRVRVRATVGGEARAVTLRGVTLRAPHPRSVHADDPKVTEYLGAEFGPVAVGQDLAGSMHFDSGAAPFTAPAVRSHGETVVVDVDADPPRPSFALRLVVPGVQKQQGLHQKNVSVRVAVRVHTDAGQFGNHVGMDDEGRVFVPFARDTLHGRRLVRVDVDVEEQEIAWRSGATERRSRCWSATVPLERELAQGPMDLGTIEVAAHAGLLRGRVVDDLGAPIPRAAVEVTDAGRKGAPVQYWTADDGRFELTGPLLRDENGALVPVVATASLGHGVDAVHSEPSAAVAQGGEVTLVLRLPARGFVELTLRDPAALPAQALQFAFVEAGGRVRELGHERVAWSGDRNETCRLGPLPPGRGTLRILLRPGVLLRSVPDLEITAGRSCRDSRLDDLDLSNVATTCRMRVVDEEGVPIAGARVEYRGASDQWSSGPSDGGGVLAIVKGPPRALRILVSAPGKQTVELADVKDGTDIRLRAMAHLCVTVKGLPADLPRADLTVFLRSVGRENLADSAQGLLGAGDAAVVPLPPPGRYHLRLTVRQPAGAGTTWAMVGQRADDVLVGKDGEALEYVVDEATVQRLREMLARK